MSNTFKATVNEEYEFDVHREELSQLDAVATSAGHYHILHGNSSHTASIESSNLSKKTYQVQVNSNTYRVAISDEVDLLIKEMGFEVGASKEQNDLISPMPGLIIDVQVSAGQEVKEGDTLVILSAMKMENSFVSHKDGMIKAVHVTKDDAVDKGQILVEFEENK